VSVFATIELSESGHQKLPKRFDPKGEGLDYGQDLPRMTDELDALAGRAGVAPITSFFDDSEMLSAEEREEVGLPPAEPKWSAVEDGLRTVRALLAALRGQGAGEGKLWDLEVSEGILSDALGKGEKFRYYLC